MWFKGVNFALRSGFWPTQQSVLSVCEANISSAESCQQYRIVNISQAAVFQMKVKTGRWKWSKSQTSETSHHRYNYWHCTKLKCDVLKQWMKEEIPDRDAETKRPRRRQTTEDKNKRKRNDRWGLWWYEVTLSRQTPACLLQHPPLTVWGDLHRSAPSHRGTWGK